VTEPRPATRASAMRIGLLIGALGRGGSERQLAELAAGLADRGHHVEVAAYAGAGPLDGFLEARGVPVRVVQGRSKRAKLNAVRQWIDAFKPDVLHGFMIRASSIAILANFPAGRCKIVASDFSTASYSRHKPVLWAALMLFRWADIIATQTAMNERNLKRLAPWLRHKVQVVRNGVDTDRFTPKPRNSGAEFCFACVGSVYRVKNPVRVVEAARILRERNVRPFRVAWYGRRGLGAAGAISDDFRAASDLVSRYGLHDVITFHGETAQVEDVYSTADALLHVSLQEGIPNAVVEAMASGLPIIVSRVSDLPLLIDAAQNGFVCDETSPAAIADAMGRMLLTDEEARMGMARRSRELAVQWFGLGRFTDDYLALYREICPHVHA
jgi:glycosyltransferase involved in cell wall biosynthesis